MENATKALLIAAAVLIVIVIIALGVRLLGAAGDSSEQAQDVSGQLASSTETHVQDIQDELSKVNPSRQQSGQQSGQ